MTLRAQPRIVRLELAVVSLPDWHPESATSPSVDVYGYVIDHPDGAIVFDTGVGTGNDFIDQVYQPEHTPLDEALLAVGIDPERVVAVVNSHLHFDHCGQNPLFYGSDVPVFAQRSELDAVAQDAMYTDARWATPPQDQRRQVAGDMEIAEGVKILATPGHTVGHQSLLIDSDEGRAVLAGQVVWHWQEFVAGEATPNNVEPIEMRSVAADSIQRLKSLEPDVVYFSHCAEYGAGQP